MKKCDHTLDRLFRAAAGPTPTSEMPLALARESLPNGSTIIALFAQRAAMIALAIIALATAGLYRTSISNDDLPTEYVMADTAIQNNLGE